MDNDGGQGGVSTLKPEGGQVSEIGAGCPPSEPSAGAESAQGGQADNYPRARTKEEVDGTIDQKPWDNDVEEAKRHIAAAAEAMRQAEQDQPVVVDVDAVQPMERIEAIEAMADYDNCIDVKAEDVQ